MMKRRTFIKLSLVLSSYALVPQFTYASTLDLSKISFSDDIANNNAAQTLIVYLYGGASQLAGNLTNIDEIKELSQSNYDAYFGSITKTKNNFWKEAGGEVLESLIESGDITVFRSCYSEVREAKSNKAHGLCTAQNQKGNFDTDGGGILSNLAEILQNNGIVNENSNMPFVSMEGESQFYATGDVALPGYLKPVGINESFDNPYERGRVRQWYYYTKEERERAPDSYSTSDDKGGFDPELPSSMDILAQQNNETGPVKENFSKRAQRSQFIHTLKNTSTPDLGDDAYHKDNIFATRMEAAVTILVKNPDTKVLTLGNGGLGGWDDHDEGRNYVRRSEKLFIALKSAMAHIKAANKANNINIIVFGDFGRNVNLNSAKGWDHGNLQNFYVLGGHGYFKHKGVVGETIVEGTAKTNRLFLKPKPKTYWFEPLSIAATLYKIYGIENPEVLTGGHKEITELFS